MVKNIAKYLLLAFLLVNFTAEYRLFASLSKTLFYLILAFSIPISILNVDVIIRGLKSCPYFLWWMIIYVVYQFTVGLDYMKSENLIYLIAKIASFGIILCSINIDFAFYLKKMHKPVGYIVVFLLLMGFNSPNFGFNNANAGCAIAAIGASCFMFNKEGNTWIDYLCLFFCIFCILIGHSRNALLTLLIIVVFRYRFSSSILSIGILGLLLLFVIVPNFGFRAESVERSVGTYEGKVGQDREKQREAALWMIRAHPWDGNGFIFKNYGKANKLSELGAHNGYLNVLECMGYGFGGLWLLVLVIGILSVLRLYGNSSPPIKTYLAIVFSILAATNYENYLVGVNQITTNMFYVSFSILCTYQYKRNKLLKRNK